ncbi:MAG: hypothetical protein IPK60_23045 [Sandaracinaceae bacterium]|nr:hypothetical protein [Sandaracinaceae bacterium]
MLNTQKNKQAICSFDPAIDPELTDVGAYAVERDLSKVVYRAGAKPEVYSLRPLRHDVCAWVCSADSDVVRWDRAFFACVVQIDSLKMFDVNGVVTEVPQWIPDSVSNRPDKIAGMFDLFKSDEKALFPPATIYEIGEVAYRNAFFPRGIAPTFVLPRTSVQILEAGFYHRAAQAKSTPTDGTSEPEQP